MLALDAHSGSRLWTSQVRLSLHPSPLVVVRDAVFCTAARASGGDAIAAFDRTDGHLLWTFTDGGSQDASWWCATGGTLLYARTTTTSTHCRRADPRHAASRGVRGEGPYGSLSATSCCSNGTTSAKASGRRVRAGCRSRTAASSSAARSMCRRRPFRSAEAQSSEAA